MAFRLRKDAKAWFRELYEAKEFSIDFDAFYFCFMAAITVGRKSQELPLSETSEMVDYFPGRYNDRSRVLVATLLATELRLLGVDMTNKKEVHSAISELIHPNSSSHLSENGVREFNKYAYSGFDVLQEWFDDRPRSLHTFLRSFKQHVDEATQATGTEIA